MAEKLTCKNDRFRGVHGCEPSYARRYNGYCLDCANAGIDEAIDEIERLTKVVGELECARNELFDSGKRNYDFAAALKEELAEKSEAIRRLSERLVRLEGRRRVRVRPIFQWRDLWVGAYLDKGKQRLYILPIPCLGVCIDWSGGL